jgi:hypothetical protein
MVLDWGEAFSSDLSGIHDLLGRSKHAMFTDIQQSETLLKRLANYSNIGVGFLSVSKSAVAVSKVSIGSGSAIFRD